MKHEMKLDCLQAILIDLIRKLITEGLISDAIGISFGDMAPCIESVSKYTCHEEIVVGSKFPRCSSSSSLMWPTPIMKRTVKDIANQKKVL